MYLTAADELVKLRNEVTRLNTHNAPLKRSARSDDTLGGVVGR
jgi:hypothetical protein